MSVGVWGEIGRGAWWRRGGIGGKGVGGGRNIMSDSGRCEGGMSGGGGVERERETGRTKHKKSYSYIHPLSCLTGRPACVCPTGQTVWRLCVHSSTMTQ